MVYRKSLTGHALYKTNNSDTSDDLVQATFLKAFVYLQKGGKINTMRIFLNHILRGLIIDEYRRRKLVSLDILLEKGFDPSFDDTEKAMDMHEGKKMILLIDRLPVKYQLVMRLRHEKDLSLSEIAAITGQTNNTVAVQLYRGLKKLKVLVHEEQQEFERCPGY